MTSVLIVDDEKNVRTTLSIGLKRYKYNVRTASNGPEALQLLNQQKSDIMISDIKMTPMDGYTLAALVRKKFPETGIILMSAYGVEEEHFSVLEKLACSRLTKPFSVEDLVHMIKKEEKKGEKGCIFVIAEPAERHKIREVVEKAGYKIMVMNDSQLFKKQIQSRKCDLFIIDSDFISETNWKILNDIEKYAHEKHVVILTHVKQAIPEKYAEFSSIDKDRFYKDFKWTRNFLNSKTNK